MRNVGKIAPERAEPAAFARTCHAALALLAVLMALAPWVVLRAQAPGVWLTTPERQHLLARQAPLVWKTSSTSSGGIITVDDTKRYQTMDGFGHALTGGSAQLLMRMSPAKRAALLRELFDAKDGIGIRYLRVSIGASDMNDHVYTYDDLPAGQTDEALAHFSLAEDDRDVVPVLHAILAIQPGLRILASPWTAPAWMKDNGKFKGGSLLPQYREAYARYLVKYVLAMQERGIRIDAVTPQNEPENPLNTPSMVMTAADEAVFVGKYLGPELARAGLKTKIIGYDHNCDHPEYALTLLRDPDAYRYLDGTGFHLYLGTLAAMTEVHDAFPAKHVYFTEQMVVPDPAKPELGVAGPVARLVVGAPEHWSRTVLLWNLAADPRSGPHTGDGGCPVCAGALTLDGDRVTRLVGYYVIAHASKFVPPGSVRVESTSPDTPPHVAFVTPQGRHVLIASNPATTAAQFTIRSRGKDARAELPAGAVATFVW